MKKIFKNLIFIFILLLIVVPVNCFARQIYVSTLNGEGINIEAESSDTIEVVKVKIYEGFKAVGNEDFLPELQKLSFNGVDFIDGRTLADYIVPGFTIHVTLIKSYYNITYKLSNLTSTDLEKVENGKDFETTLKANFGYKLPDTITILVNGNNISNYTYDKDSGKVVIDKEVITGDIEISAIGVAEEANPKTFDGIEKSFISGGLSILGIIMVSIYLFLKRGA